MKSWLLGILILVMPAVGYGQHLSSGFGGADCGQWIRQPSGLQKTWLMGFVSGMNEMYTIEQLRQTKNPMALTDPLQTINSAEQIYVWMDNYCRKNPLRAISDGGRELFLSLVSKKR